MHSNIDSINWPNIFSEVIKKDKGALKWGLPEPWVHAELYCTIIKEKTSWTPFPDEVPYITYYPVILPKLTNRDWESKRYAVREWNAPLVGEEPSLKTLIKIREVAIKLGCVFWPKFELSLRKILNQIFKSCPNDSVQPLWWLSKTEGSSLRFFPKTCSEIQPGRKGGPGGIPPRLFPLFFVDIFRCIL